MPLYAWVFLTTGPPQEVGAAVEEHREQRRGLRERGKLRVAGEFDEGDGFLEIFDAVDRHEAEALARSSPLVERGLGSWMLKRWTELD